METTTSAPAKAILFGEHAVVYGYPAIAVPLPDIRATATIKDAEEDTIAINALDLGWTEKLSQLPDNHPIRYTIDLFLSEYKIKPTTGFNLSLHSKIPIASGMGSGAAISTAIFKGLFSYFQISYTNAKLSELVYEVEKLHHGTPSGIDNTVTAFEQAIFFRKGKPIQTIHFPYPFHLVIANSGFSTPTKLTVGDVRGLYEENPDEIEEIFRHIEENTTQGLDSLTFGKLSHAGQMMTKNHELLKALNVSDERLDKLVSTSLANGAYGAKLSGGGRGGIIIALTEEENRPFLKHALLTAGAESCFSTKIGGE